MMTNKRAIILLSGGLDSLVATACAVENYDVLKALFFNYGQKSFLKEKESFEKICKYYNLKGEIVDLNWYPAICTCSAGNIDKDFWLPNRNGLFANIGACYAEALNCDVVIIGANSTEAKEFKDNSKSFIESVNVLFKNSTQNEVELVAPLVDTDKNGIVKKGIELNVPFEFVWSCYYDGEKHCGNCPSCKLLKQALIDNGKTDLQKILF